MSIQLMVAAAYLPPEVISNPAEKLALMKICDSADDETRLSRPGMHRMAAWTGVTEKRAITLVTKLVAKGLVERVEVGRPGRAALYKVFPLGVPDTPDREELRERQRAAVTAPRNPRLARPRTPRATPAAPARTYLDVEEREQRAARRHGLPEGNPPTAGAKVPPGEPNTLPEGNPPGSPGGTPSFPSPSYVLPTPLPPTADAAGEPADPEGSQARPCSRHRKVAANCRACGTSARAQRQAEERDRTVARRQREQEWLSDFRRDAQVRREQAEVGSDAVRSARREAFEAVRAARQRAKYHE
ncbi:helix-turn-helix domain-containing protein [Kitasatospora brasiliensis]|uniref:helix-turn-helix domain-containing protein n=1 Tax=Kitasatospora brasiliensis TaxID=3058040 RepID=UPI0029312578|nr:helix-turn-helix domain-containing protein [Kitasatospora sp. K002]